MTIRIFFALALLLPPAIGTTQTRPHTAGNSVHVISPPLAMPGLDRTRTIRVYLPPGYAQGSKRYRVLYMHDAQNLFDDATSFVGEWGVDEAMDALAKSDGIELIVVGIDHGDKDRINELRPWAHPGFGAAQGDAYLDFAVGTVKPFIDRNYRSRTQRNDTGIMGSSLGALISHYAMFRHGNIFGRFGILSPSYWVADDIYAYSEARRLKRGTRIYLAAGDKEGREPVEWAKNAEKVRRMELALQRSQGRRIALSTTIRAGAGHDEAAWRREFPEAVRFLFGRGR